MTLVNLLLTNGFIGFCIGWTIYDILLILINIIKNRNN